MKSVFLFFAFVRLLAAVSPIAFIASSNGGCNGSAISTCNTNNLTIAANNTIIIQYSILTTTSTGNAPTDPAGNTYTQLSGCALNNSTSVRVECWSTPPGGSKALAAQAITCNLSAASNLQCRVVAYSGAIAFGPVTTATGSSANPVSPAVTAQDSNNFCVGFFAGVGANASTALTGNLRNSTNNNGLATAITDNVTFAVGASCTSSVTNTDTVWALAAVMLRPISPSIVFSPSSTGGCTATAASTCTTNSITVPANSTIFVQYVMLTTTSTGNAPTDQASNSYTLVPGCAQNNSVSIRVECWSTPIGASKALASQTVTCNLSANSNLECRVVGYFGATAIGSVVAATASGANPTSPTITTQDSNNWCIGFFGGVGATVPTALTGNLRTAAAANGIAIAVTDNTAIGPGSSCTTSITDTDTVYANAAVELRIPLGTMGPI